MICKQVDWFDLVPILFITLLNETELICLHTVKWFQVLLCNSNNLTSVIHLLTLKWTYI